jgi:cell wall-associated NlpC family hydrolase
VIRTALATALSLALAACAGSPSKIDRPSSPAVPAAAADLSPITGELLVDRARTMLGQPYRFGGAAPGGFDCSGLVVYAANGAGIGVPRTAAEQLRSGTPVARGELRAGDLIFMHLAHKELHVGIAIDGERFIHAPSTGGHVRIDSLAAAPYAGAFIGARRIIAAP